VATRGARETGGTEQPRRAARSARRIRRGRGRVSEALVEHLPLGIVVATSSSRSSRSFVVVNANRAAQQLTGAELTELAGRHVSSLFTSENLDEMLAAVVRTGEPATIECTELRVAGREGRSFALRAFRAGRRTIGVSVEDVTDRLVAAAALQHRALHDALTGLPNRVLLGDRLRHGLLEARRTGDPVALLLLDLNQFKGVNDQLGHHHGDRLLVAVATRLRDALRECDTVARLGGDEFALLLADGSGLVGARAVAHKVTETLREPFVVDGMTISMQASIGIAVSPDHGDDAETLTRHADAAMYKAKRSGGGAAVYDRDSERSNAQRLTLASELERAIGSGELRLAYQPILDVVSKRIERVEALVRWQHPNLGLLPPREFVDLAALSGVIRPLTSWVLERGLAQAAEWRQMGITLSVSVNLAAHNLFELELPGLIAEQLRVLELPGDVLTVEISESELMEDPRAALDVVGQMRAFGVRTSIDDFGTGSSSLGTLQDLPINEIKIDSSFVAKLDGSEASTTVVRSIADLGRNLGVAVVAEGVQTGEALALVAQLGCRFAQGYHIGPPMSAGAVGLVAAATQEPAPSTIDIRDPHT
jgi:diguanylate cyclase (GGDEF)-like protein/PAS domain S-box-containing protein